MNEEEENIGANCLGNLAILYYAYIRFRYTVAGVLLLRALFDHMVRFAAVAEGFSCSFCVLLFFFLLPPGVFCM